MESANVDYPKKNNSSVMLWNCGHKANRELSREYVGSATPQHLHRFEWLYEHEVGELPIGWNYLVGEEPPASANLYHHTLGVPGIGHYSAWHASWHWHEALLHALECAGEDPVAMVKRSKDAVR
jgi:hypothetical protein